MRITGFIVIIVNCFTILPEMFMHNNKPDRKSQLYISVCVSFVLTWSWGKLTWVKTVVPSAETGRDNLSDTVLSTVIFPYTNLHIQ